MDARRIAITGVTRGLGRALVYRFADAGHVVFGCARSAERLDRLRRELPAPHAFARVDVADDAQVERWARSVLDAGPAPDLLINNAALLDPPAPLWEQDAEAFGRVIDVNIKGVASVIRHFVPALISRRAGVIVNISSGWGRSTSPGVASYCATKWAIEGLTSALAAELPPPLAAVTVNPGIIRTEMLERAFGRESARGYVDPERWSRVAAPFLLGLGRSENGRQLEIEA